MWPEATVVTQEFQGEEEEVIVGLFLVELLDLFFHLSQLGDARDSAVLSSEPCKHGETLANWAVFSASSGR